MRSFPLAIRHKLSSVISAEQGASAIEFALLAPFLIFALLGTVDVGRALTEQMALGSILRTGAQSAIAGGDVGAVDRVLRAAKDDASVLVAVRPLCACPENSQAEVDCSTTCAGPGPTAIYYSLAAQKEFSGIFLPDKLLSRSIQVQVR
ncbi:pilus assembly protein [Paracoccus sp. Z118]|nr:pilus assembly protein [Paracoccus sp. Z118]